ncbi:class I SAM-dependent methyltransferase [Streptomyces tendae]|uniref:class I SAM-dependent methyltransferase n=1 Tax=Streptomyces tendae TaxID=1932 RepID=UPI0036A926DD
MDFEKYTALIQDPATRHEKYAEMVSSYFDAFTDLYREVWSDSLSLTWFTEPKSLAEAQKDHEHKVADLLGVTPGMRVLDVGCGIGNPALEIAARTGAHITGVTISAHQVEVANAKIAAAEASENVAVVHGDAMRLPFPDDSFDAVYAIQAIGHTPDKPQVYREVSRVLRDDGVFVCSDGFLRAGTDLAKHGEAMETLFQTFAVPSVNTIPECQDQLRAAGFAMEYLTRYSDHGDLGPNWTVGQQIAQKLMAGQGEGSEFSSLFGASMEAVRKAAETGALELYLWAARKLSGSRP